MGKKNQGQKQANPPKGKPIHPRLNPKQPKVSQKVQSSKPQSKMVNVFQIIPQNDNFAALGFEDQEEQVECQEEASQQLQGQEELQSYEGQLEPQNWQGEDQQEGSVVGGEEQDQIELEKVSQHQNGLVEGLDEEEGGEYEEEEEGGEKQPVDASVISLQIQQCISILMNIQRLGNGKPRKYHVDNLRQLFHTYYGYNLQLIDHFLAFVNPAELVQLFEANETQRPLTIRTNTLKTRRKELAQSLIQRGVNLDPLAEWSKVGIKIYESKVPIGATPEYLAGHYMLQSASSLLPVLALDPQPGERILDMASAPGGKTTYIAQLMKNTGCIFANDLKKERLKALQFNLFRLGVTNTTVTCRDGRKYSAIFPNSFDRVLLDAPCTGLGIISKDPSIKANRLLLDIYKNSHLQKQLLLSAIDCTRVGGVIVYSTCSVSPLQNEEVVNFAVRKRFVKIQQTEVEVGEEGLTKFVEKRFHPDLKHTRRIYPHVHNMDGFYLAKLVKVGKGKRQTQLGQEEDM